MVFVKSHDIDELTTELIGRQVVLGGWIEDLRKLGKMTFITLRDVSGISQIIVKGLQSILLIPLAFQLIL